jgi:hypothetical protein
MLSAHADSPTRLKEAGAGAGRAFGRQGAQHEGHAMVHAGLTLRRLQGQRQCFLHSCVASTVYRSTRPTDPVSLETLTAAPACARAHSLDRPTYD